MWFGGGKGREYSISYLNNVMYACFFSLGLNKRRPALISVVYGPLFLVLVVLPSLPPPSSALSCCFHRPWQLHVHGICTGIMDDAVRIRNVPWCVFFSKLIHSVQICSEIEGPFD